MSSIERSMTGGMSRIEHRVGTRALARMELQTDIGLIQVNADLVFERNWADTDGTELKYQWQALQRLRAGLRLGLQGFGELGPWDHWSASPSHRAGPVLRLGLWGKSEIQASYLWGKAYGSRGDMFSTQLLLPL